MKATPRPTPTAHPPQDQAADGEPGSPLSQHPGVDPRGLHRGEPLI
jgi:hypothetical protein